MEDKSMVVRCKDCDYITSHMRCLLDGKDKDILETREHPCLNIVNYIKHNEK